jgi:N-acetylglucosamine-6-phosphate deacetylase
MSILIKGGNVVFPDGIREENILIKDDKIVYIGQNIPQANLIIDAKSFFVTPGFIDIHLHGGGGHDFMEATDDAFTAICNYHLFQGATSQVPTAITAPSNEIIKFLEGFKNVMESNKIDARLLGVHLEGPYLSFEKKGAHPQEFLRLPDPKEYENWIEKYPFIIRMTIAPELEGALDLGDYLHNHNINASIGHSNAFGSEVDKAIEHGYTSVTHLFNAMSSYDEHQGMKAAGVAEMALLRKDLFVEVISDLQHVPKELIHLAYRIKESKKMILVSDCLAPAGMEKGEYYLGNKSSGMPVDVKDAVYLRGQKKLAGSVASVNTLLKNVVSIGIGLVDAVNMLSLTPAQLIGQDYHLGSISIDKCADILLLDGSLNVKRIICKGKIIL